MAAVNGADLVLPDGVGVVWAAKRFGTPLPERVAGIDLLSVLLERMSGSVYVLGGRPGVAEKAAENIAAAHPNVAIAGTHGGYFTDELALTAELGETRPDLLLVCLGAPKQELWMAAHRDLPVGLMAGLGGTVDVLAGTAERAPLRWRKHGLEWLYRMLRQPSRLKRQRSLVSFVWEVIVRKET
jgi:N-acetylglucosaminyldiphosphoundecaprenol N-acetyl-beta-D-mannosaminyltransferase